MKLRQFIKKNWCKLLATIGIATATISLASINTYAYTYNPSDGTLVSDNLLNINNVEQTTINGVTYSVSNGVITLNGTATSNTYGLAPYRLYDLVGDYVLSNFGSLSLLYAYRVGSGNYTYGNVAANSFFKFNFTTATELYVYKDLNAGLTYSGNTIPMLLKGVNAPTSFEPYGQKFYSEQAFNSVVTNNFGIWGKMDYLQVDSFNYMSDEMNPNYLATNGFLNGSSLLTYELGSLNDNDSEFKIHVYFPNISLDYFKFYTLDKESVYKIWDSSSNLSVISISEPRELTIEDVKNLNDIQEMELSYSSTTVASRINNDTAYYDGFSSGYKEGATTVYPVAREEGYQEGHEIGYQEGYNLGAQENFATNGFMSLIYGIFSYPITLVSSMFNFEFMGINIFGLISFIFTLGIIIYVLSKFIGGKKD